MNNMSWNGIPIIVNEFVPEFMPFQYKFPKSKKKRIRNKWKKNKDNFRSLRGLIHMNNQLLMHPNTFENFRHIVGNDTTFSRLYNI